MDWGVGEAARSPQTSGDEGALTLEAGVPRPASEVGGDPVMTRAGYPWRPGAAAEIQDSPVVVYGKG